MKRNCFSNFDYFCIKSRWKKFRVKLLLESDQVFREVADACAVYVQVIKQRIISTFKTYQGLHESAYGQPLEYYLNKSIPSLRKRLDVLSRMMSMILRNPRH